MYILLFLVICLNAADSSESIDSVIERELEKVAPTLVHVLNDCLNPEQDLVTDCLDTAQDMAEEVADCITPRRKPPCNRAARVLFPCCFKRRR